MDDVAYKIGDYIYGLLQIIGANSFANGIANDRVILGYAVALFVVLAVISVVRMRPKSKS